MDPFGVAFLCRCALRVVFVIVNNIYCIPTYVVWMMMFFPIKKCHPDLYWRIEGYFFHWLLAMVSMWSWSAGYDIVEIGDDITICLEDRTLVIANHQSTADVPLLMASFNAKKNILPNLMWIMDRIFKYTNFGIVSILHQDFFIVSGKDKRDASLQALVTHLQEAYIPRCRKWMVLFPEGGFLRKRRETSQRYALKNNLPVLNHVSLPRVGALKTIMNVVGPLETGGSILQNNICDRSRPYELKWVLDITIAYPNGQPLDLPTIVTGQREPCKTFLFYRLYPCHEVPQDNEALTKWLYDRFVEKEQMLETYYKTGVFPTKEFCAEPIPPQTVSQDCLRFLILHLFFITSSYFHFHLFSYVFSHFW